MEDRRIDPLQIIGMMLIFGIFMSVIIYYVNYFSSLLGNNGILPIHISIWMPLLILFLICNIGLLKINEK